LVAIDRYVDDPAALQPQGLDELSGRLNFDNGSDRCIGHGREVLEQCCIEAVFE
jgi:hypothetical protein